MSDNSTSNLYEYLRVGPDCPDSELYLALERVAAMVPKPPWLSHAEDVLRNPRARGYYNARHGLPTPQGRPGRPVPVAGQELQHRAAEPERHAGAGVPVQRSPVAGLLEAEWPLTIPLPTGVVLKPPFPFVDICHPDTVGRIDPNWVPPRVLEWHDAHVPGQELLALLFPLRSDAQEPGSPEVWLRVIACSAAGGPGITGADLIMRRFLSDTLAAKLVASAERTTKNNAKAQVGLHECTGRYRACGYIRIDPVSSLLDPVSGLRDLLEKAMAPAMFDQRLTLTLFAATDRRYDYVIRELFMSL